MNRNASTYLISTFLFSWILWTPSVLEYFGVISFGSEELSNAIYFITIIIGAFGPAFGSFVALRKEKQSFKQHLKKLFSIKGISNLGLFLSVILVVPLIINGSSILFGTLLSLEIPPMPLPNDPWYTPYLLYIPYLLFVSTLGGGQEEIGWRGYLQGELLKKYNPALTSIIIGLFWGFWHTPLWFMLWDGHTFTPYIGFVIMTMSISFVYSYFYQSLEGNLLLMLLFHGSNNASHALLYLFYDDKPASAQSLYWIYVAMNVIAGFIAYLLMKRNQKHKESLQDTV
ncbi:MAG: CPBP family intramembrane metalloprotease [Candidatus Bathyarchaeota archaeon]|nr:CPBP family intramembrane metalloprotease [Candidatus Bathyarchaeota archaeon]